MTYNSFYITAVHFQCSFTTYSTNISLLRSLLCSSSPQLYNLVHCSVGSISGLLTLDISNFLDLFLYTPHMKEKIQCLSFPSSPTQDLPISFKRDLSYDVAILLLCIYPMMIYNIFSQVYMHTCVHYSIVLHLLRSGNNPSASSRQMTTKTMT